MNESPASHTHTHCEKAATAWSLKKFLAEANFFYRFSMSYILSSARISNLNDLSLLADPQLEETVASFPFLWLCKKRQINTFTFFHLIIIIKIFHIWFMWNLTISLKIFFLFLPSQSQHLYSQWHCYLHQQDVCGEKLSFKCFVIVHTCNAVLLVSLALCPYLHAKTDILNIVTILKDSQHIF